MNYSSIVALTVPYTTVQSPWFAQWFQDPSFTAAARQQWNALKNAGVFKSWIAFSAEAGNLQQAQANNFGRWPMQGIQVWPNPKAGGSYQAELNYLTAWLTLRMGYMDSFLNGTLATATTLSTSTASQAAGIPVTMTAKVNGSNPTGTVFFSYNSVVLGQAALDGAGQATLATSSIPPGTWQLSAAYAGDSNNALSISANSSVTVAPVLLQTSVNLNASLTSVLSRSPIALTAAVIGNQGTATPTGTVTFSAGSTNLGTATLSSGIAALTVSNLPSGITSIQAQYSGSSTFAASTSNALQIQLFDDLSLTAPSPAAITVSAGTLSNLALTLPPSAGTYPGNVTLELSNVPSTLNCALSTTTVAANAGAQQIGLTCTGLIPQRASVAAPPAAGKLLLCGLLLLPLPWAPGRRGRLRLLTLVLCLGLGGFAFGLTGCGSGSANSGTTSPVTSNVVVTATAGLVQHSATVAVTVQ